MTSGEPQPPQRGRGRPPLISRDSIIETACNLGLDGLSMSSVADELGVATQSLYRHVASRRELVTLCVDHLTAGWIMTEDHGQPLSEWLYQFAVDTRQFLSNSPGLAAELQSIGPGTPQIVYKTEHSIDSLVQRGHSPLISFLLIGAIGESTIASVVRQEQFLATPEARENSDSRALAALAEIDPIDIPHITSITEFLIDTNGDEYFKFFTRSLIDGMIQRLLPDD